MESNPNKPLLKRHATLLCRLVILSVLGFLPYLAWEFWNVIGWNIELVKSLPTKCNSADISDLAKCTEITRNFGWGVWMLLSTIGVGFGLWLTWQGRQIQRDQWKTQNSQWNTQHKSHLQERFEKASDMLSSELEATRIAACLSLADLGETEESMKSRCVQLLFAFINEPYLEKHEVEVYIRLKGRKKDEYFTDLFPANEPLRPDIQQAIVNFSAIYKHYGKVGVGSENSRLPSYFWKNRRKGNICLIKANFGMITGLGMFAVRKAVSEETNLQEAYLRSSNLYGINLQKVNLCKADLWRANLHEANLRGADLREAILPEANLREVNLQNANLQEANLQRANLREANLQRANLQEANFDGANLTDADISQAGMRKVKNLTKEQILSAKWGYRRYGTNRGNMMSPQLPEDLMQDEDIKKWLETPTYDERRKLRDSQ